MATVGKVKAGVGDGELAHWGNANNALTLKDHIRRVQEGRESQYMFDREFSDNAGRLFAEFTEPPLGKIEVAWKTRPFTFSLGPSGSGVSWHVHTAAWLEVIAGKKLWQFSPPSGKGITEAGGFNAMDRNHENWWKEEQERRKNSTRHRTIGIQTGANLHFANPGWYPRNSPGPS